MRHTRLKQLSAGLVIAVIASFAGAQPTTLKPPAPSGDPEPPVVMTWLTIALATGAVVVAMALPTKRGHQD